MSARRCDYSDMVIELLEGLADENVILQERIASLEAEVGTYRELALVAFDALRRVTDRDRDIREANDRLNNLNHALSEELFLQSGVEDFEGATA